MRRRLRANELAREERRRLWRRLMLTPPSFTERIGFAYGVASTIGWIPLYVLALQGADVRVNRWITAAVMGVQLYLFTETTRRFRPRPSPVLEPTKARIRWAQLVYFSSHAVLVFQGVRGMAAVATYDGIEDDPHLAGLLMATALAMSVNIAVGFGLCYHNVLFWVMPPEDRRQPSRNAWASRWLLCRFLWA